MFGVLCIFPIWVGVIYNWKIGSNTPKPDLDDSMQIEDIKLLYGTIDIEKIRKNVYTESKHE